MALVCDRCGAKTTVAKTAGHDLCDECRAGLARAMEEYIVSKQTVSKKIARRLNL